MRALWVVPLAVLGLLALAPGSAFATETCGNGVDDDADGLADEGCMPSITTGVCESPHDCGLNGAVSPLTGALTNELDPDLAPVVPKGPSLDFQRFYTSAYAPGGSAPAYRKPMGEHWQHSFMSWLDLDTSTSPDTVVLHTPRGQDVLFTYNSTSGGYDYYTPQTGFHVVHLRQATSSPYKWELKDLEGQVLVYDFDAPSSSGKLIEIRDSLATPNVVTVAYDGNGQVWTVTDASGTRRLLFGYSSGNLSSVAFRTYFSGTFITRSSVSYSYTSGELTASWIGGALHAYTYSGGLLTTIEDADGNDLAVFAYENGTDKVVRVDTGDGAIGYEYGSSRASCSGKTVLYFNAPTAITCDDDSDCASVSTDLMCGGETDSSSSNTGKCYYAGRCLTVSSPNDDLVTTVTPVAPSGGTCAGACTDVAEYGWNGSAMTLKGTKDPDDNWTSYTYDSNGLPTLIVTGDTDDDATNSGGSKTWFFYGNNDFPGRVTEVRRPSVQGGTCNATTSSGCQRTLMFYNSDGLLESIEETGYTLDSSNTWVTFDYTTGYSYDSAGRLTQIDGPLSGSNDVTDFEYWSSSDILLNGYLRYHKRKKDSSSYVTSEYATYDYWGKPTTLVVPDGTLTCFTYDTYQGFLVEKRETMDGQTSCTPDSSDIVTTWDYDTMGRVRSIQTPGGSCTYRDYDSVGRLSTVALRDDCNPASSGDTTTYTYGDGDRVIEVEVTDASSSVTRRREVSYHESRRLKGIEDPASSQSSTLTYDVRGLVTQIDAPSSLGKTVYSYDEQGRKTERRNYSTSTDYDAWTIAYDFLFSLAPTSVTDEDAKEIATDLDDLGRRVRQVTPDSVTTLWEYDAAGRVIERNEAYGTSGAQSHAFSYDHLGRLLTADYASSCGTGAGPEVSYVYDAPPSSCPSGASCQRTEGRLAYVKTSLFCDTSLSDDSVDQETHYSYDRAGRITTERKQDDTSRITIQMSTWTKSGALASHMTPSAATLGATFGGSGNSDNEQVQTLWRGSSSSPVVDQVTWYPFGGLKSYRHQNTTSSHQMQTVIDRDLAGRVSDVLVEDSVSGTDVFDIAVTRDDKGRVTVRDYTGGHSGLQDSHFTYDLQDRLLCESASSGSCPTSGSSLKNNISGSPPYTPSSDLREFRHAIPGYSATLHEITYVSGTSQIDNVDQPSAYGQTDFGYDDKRDRLWETNYGYDEREYGYDDRRNLVSVNGYFKPTSMSGWHTYYLTNMFDQSGRRVGKLFYDATANQLAAWYFYYDPAGRLVEAQHWPDTSTSSVFSVFQVSWLGARPVAMFQTDYPAGTLSRRYVHTDDSGRIVDMYSWPSSGDASRVWSLNPDAGGNAAVLVGGSVFQPLVLGGGYSDDETAAWYAYGQMQRPPLVHIDGGGVYDSWLGVVLQARAGRASADGWNPYVNELVSGGSQGQGGALARAVIRACHWENTSSSYTDANGVEHISMESELVCYDGSGGSGGGGGGGPRPPRGGGGGGGGGPGGPGGPRPPRLPRDKNGRVLVPPVPLPAPPPVIALFGECLWGSQTPWIGADEEPSLDCYTFADWCQMGRVGRNRCASNSRPSCRDAMVRFTELGCTTDGPLVVRANGTACDALMQYCKDSTTPYYDDWNWERPGG